MFADRIQIQQVLVNVFRNAIDATQGVERGSRRLEVTAKVRDGEVEISVSDTGCGFPEGAADDIFQAFYTNKPQGTGLGLSISRTIVEAHGGRIWAKRNADAGATIAFTLPLNQSPSGP